VSLVPTLLSRDDGLLVLSKPSGLKLHPANNDGAPDVVTWLEAKHPEYRPVHRLDRETSGVLLCAAEGAPRRELSHAFAEGAVAKTYLALVYGRTHRKDLIRTPLYDKRRRRELVARTRIRRIEWFPGFTLVRAEPQTGRKHQIRRHLHGEGHPVVGDTRYKQVPFRRVPGFPGRLWLHASKLVLPDGRTFEAPLPPELAAHLEVMAALPEGEEPASR